MRSGGILRIRQLLLSVALVLCAGSVKAFDVPVDTLASRLETQKYLYPQEKIHLVTDREQYMASDTVWFRAFMVDASSHQPVSVSKYVYVELLNPFNEVEERVKIIERGGEFSGYLPLDTKMYEGQYTIAAYTMFMENAGQDYFFRKSINITSPFSSRVTLKCEPTYEADGGRKLRVEYRDRSNDAPLEYKSLSFTYPNGKSRNYTRGTLGKTISLGEKDNVVLVTVNGQIGKYVYAPRRDDYDVTFHPEGGYMIPGKACKIAFKAIGTDGSGREVSGVVVDKGGNEVTIFRSQHRGMGLFTMVPSEGGEYEAIVRDAEGKEKRFSLPKAESKACVLHVDATRSKDKIYISVEGGETGKTYNISVQERGTLIQAGTLKGGDYVAMEKPSMPAGVIQILLMDDSGKRLSERLVFNKQMKDADIVTDKPAYVDREQAKVDIDLTGYSSNKGSLAISVTDNSTIKAGRSQTILTNLLLQSDLKGHIEDAGYYFMTGRDDSITVTDREKSLDILMMTQGWSRYDIPKVLKSRYSEPRYPIERGQEISGIVRSYWKNKPMPGATANVIVPKLLYVNAVVADSVGRFHLNGFDFPDGTKFLLQALNKKGKNEMNFTIDSPKYPQIERLSLSPMSAKTGIDAMFINKEFSRLSVYGGLSVMLDEITVTAKKNRTPEEIYRQVMVSKSFDYKDFDKLGMTSYEDAIRKFAGVYIDYQNRVLYRGSGVTFVVDGSVFEGIEFTGTGGGGSSKPMVYSSGGGTLYSAESPGSGFMRGSNTKLSEVENVIPFSAVRQIDFVQPNFALVFGMSAAVGGAIVITTKDGSEETLKGELSNIKSVIPLGYQTRKEFYNPRYEYTGAGPVEGADLRSTVYWNPSVKIDSDGHSKISFYANDVADTSYTINIEGITDTGELIYATKKIEKQ